MEMTVGRGAVGGRRRGSEAFEVGDSGSESQSTGITPPPAETLGPVASASMTSEKSAFTGFSCSTCLLCWEPSFRSTT